tara:strand:+ start:2881 stop:4530 length:1650 start_codon:yes stop_codon:yes gene_type:complete
MRLLPENVYRFESNAEKKIFAVLGKSSSDGVALHSINLPEHEYKQWSEADFVIVSKRGILVLEVKGGRVACNSGVWEYTNRYGEVHRKSEGPYMQAKSARVALQKRLEGIVETALLRKINFGFGVMFPDILYANHGVEIPTEAIYDARHHEAGEVEAWVRRLYKFWEQENHKTSWLEEYEVDKLVKAIRPEFDLVPAISSRVGDMHREQVRLTERQYQLLDIMLVQSRVLVQGGAGTGKTFLAVEASRRLVALGKKVLFLCRSPVFAWVMQSRLANSFVNVLSLDSAKELAENNNLPQFDVLVVDEGQDLLDIDSIEFVDSIIGGGLERGHWLFFMDSNNQGSLYERYDNDVLGYLAGSGVPFPLNFNCRNTKEIALQTMVYTGADIGKCVVNSAGLPVETYSYQTREQLASRLNDLLAEWVDQQGVTPGHITVLSPLDFNESIVSMLNSRWRRRFYVIDNNFGGTWHDSMLTFSNVVDFKGLENRYVVLVDLEGFTATREDISMLYVGMTRSSCFLFMAVPDAIRIYTDACVERNTLRIVEMNQKGIA